ncbi:MAG: phospholipid carrier-dependent glycosyltransferase, partial [Phycisphaerales bacterium]|nr:phospholipid carrier-dependent glycosyltransferase [Phycisphaerales bacterium]
MGNSYDAKKRSIINSYDGRMKLRVHGYALLLITLLGGALRFYRLDEPRIWLDEALTFSRICGTFHQLGGILKYDGFMPLHYVVTWLLTQVTYPTPFVLRLMPASCGTLLVPATYLLARQMTGRKQALLAALFTACSAYYLSFSRDAKMYMPTWFFATLFAALLLMWLRPKTGDTRR